MLYKLLYCTFLKITNNLIGFLSNLAKPNTKIDETNLYDENFYRNFTTKEKIKNSEIIFPVIQQYIKIESVIDIGCGVGAWSKYFFDNNISVKGIDFGNIPEKYMAVPKNNYYINQNLNERITINQKFDILINIEVAEHLKKTRANSFIEDLTKLSDIILFSAAIPYQGGTGHINEQYPEYWARKFKKHNFIPIDLIRPSIWKNNEIYHFWVKQNFILFVKKGKEKLFPKRYHAKSSCLTRIYNYKVEAVKRILNKFFTFFIRIYNKIWRIINFRLLPEKFYIKKTYKYEFGDYPNIKNPQTLNEKIQWLKLFDRTDLHTLCADKYKVKFYVENIIGKKYIIPTLFHSKNIKEINFQNIPDVPIILKANHDCGSNIVIQDKNKADWTYIQKYFSKKQKGNYYYSSKEWQYKNIEKRIIAEKFLFDKNNKPPMDYKFHCFNGRVEFIQVDINRQALHRRNWYLRNWEKAPFYWTSKKSESPTIPSSLNVKKPKKLVELIHLSEKLSDKFRYVRIDWFVVDDEIYFNEITFHHDGGNRRIIPQIWDYKLGKLLEL